MRINKYLAECGICSRRAADEMIAEGRVKVNGVTAVPGMDVEPGKDIIIADGGKTEAVGEFTYIMFHKPKGCLSTVRDERGRKTVFDYIAIKDVRLFPVGRLDYDAEGLLLLTNDGDLAFRLTHPKNEIEKTYMVKVEGTLNEKEVTALKNGVEWEGEKFGKAKVKLVEVEDKISRFEVKIAEGKNHELRKMFDSVGKKVIFIRRVAVGDLKLGGLGRGLYRHLKEDEVFYLKNV